jgi:exonuclease SbcD
MKILHTADWHVGRTLRGRSRADEHRQVLAEMVGIARAEAVDLVIVAGDLFDSAAPPADAEELVYEALLGLAASGAEVVVIAGNHDSAYRMKAVRPLLGLTRIHTAPFPVRSDEGGVLRFRTKSGEDARIAVLPFVSQRGIVKADQLMAGDADEHAQAYGDRCRRIMAHLAESFSPDCVNLVVSHLAITGGDLGGGERPAHTVFDYFAPAQIFPPTAHYVALGHLHRSQAIAGACPIWYPGSPLQLDFGDSEEQRSVLLVNASPGKPARVESRALTAGRPLRTISGTLRALEGMIGSVGDAFLRVVVHESARAGLADEVRALFPNAVDVTIRSEDAVEVKRDDRSLSRSPVELFEQYLREKNVDDAALVALFGELLEEVHATDAP